MRFFVAGFALSTALIVGGVWVGGKWLVHDLTRELTRG
jgi:hypothetical protein